MFVSDIDYLSDCIPAGYPGIKTLTLLLASNVETPFLFEYVESTYRFNRPLA